ncbi:MAG: helix-turn-helix domain-containing protein [Aquabacterium sp.]
MAHSSQPLMTPGQLGHLLVSARKARKLNQAQLATRVGLSQSRVSYLELHPEDLSLAQAMAWCAVLGLELSVGSKNPSPANDPTSAAW